MIYRWKKLFFQTFLLQESIFIFDLPLTYCLHFKNDLAHVLPALHAGLSFLRLLQRVDAVYDGLYGTTLQVRVNMLQDLFDHDRFLGEALCSQGRAGHGYAFH